jgi:pimeloyl-ACP methyl ester carboxylesterase
MASSELDCAAAILQGAKTLGIVVMRFYLHIAVASLMIAISHPAAATACVPVRQTVSLPLPGFDSPAEIVTPPAGMARRGALVLFPGSDVADRDGAIEGVGGKIVSRPMLQIAGRLACAGYVSFRYNKRFVTGPTSVDRAKFDALNGVDFAADGKTALNFVRSRAGIGKLPLGLVGWSEGTTTAMAVASNDSTVRTIVLIAPVVDTAAHVAQAQYGRIGRPYLMRFATDGALDADAIARADAGPGGDLAHIFVRMFRGFRPGKRVNPLLDRNGDGRIAFAEADPVIASWYADGPDSGLGMSSSSRALRGVSDAFAATTARILILQGMNDSMIDPAAARAFVARSDVRQRVTMILYPELGHSLGRAESAQNDSLLPMESKPLDDMAKWLQKADRR